MGIIYLIFAAAVIVPTVLWLGLWGRLNKKIALTIAVLAMGGCGGLLLLAVLPGNSFYGPVLTKVETKERVIALTFDDGPYGLYTRELVQLLKQKNVPATFFMVGENMRLQPELVRLAAEAPQRHQLALHAGQHKDLLKLSSKELKENIDQGKSAFRDILGYEPTMMRPPHGFKDWRVMSVIKEAQLEAVNWSIIPRDWTNPGAEVIAARVIEQAEPGAIVLLHDGDSPARKASRRQTIEATALIIDELRLQGYQFVTVEELKRKVK